MKTMTMTEFRKTFKDKLIDSVFINPYYQYEGWSAKTVHITNLVSEITRVTYRRKQIGLIIPKNESIIASLQPHYAELVNLLRIDAPFISVFTPDSQRIGQVNKPIN